MLAQILAVLAVATLPAPAPAPSTPAAPSNTVSPLVVVPETGKPPIDAVIDMAGDDDTAWGGQYVAVWPASAYHSGTDGRVILRCKIDIHGLAEWCGVASETPAGKGFGAAALEMRTTFKLTPAQGPDGPVEAIMNIAVQFKAPDFQYDPHNMTFSGNRLAMRAVTMLNKPVWAEAPTFDDLAAAYPTAAGGVEGYTVGHCQVVHTGALSNCAIVKELPINHGFRKAAMSVVHKFRVIPELATAPHSTPIWVDVPIRFSPPAAIADRKVTAPVWLTGVDPKMAPRVFPPEAAAHGLTTGRGVARCVVGLDGAMTQCAPEPGDPDGQGFSEAVVKLASTMKMNLWSADAAPVEGGQVRIAIRLNLKGGD
jgi:TonB family protein